MFPLSHFLSLSPSSSLSALFVSKTLVRCFKIPFFHDLLRLSNYLADLLVRPPPHVDIQCFRGTDTFVLLTILRCEALSDHISFHPTSVFNFTNNRPIMATSLSENYIFGVIRLVVRRRERGWADDPHSFVLYRHGILRG
jgi:hypothetical protein